MALLKSILMTFFTLTGREEVFILRGVKMQCRVLDTTDLAFSTLCPRILSQRRPLHSSFNRFQCLDLISKVIEIENGAHQKC